MHFELTAIIPMCIMFIVSAVETVGDTSAITEGGLGREPSDRELRGAVMCDGLGSSLASIFGVLPNTSFAQNVGLITMTKIVNRFCIGIGACFLVLCGLLPKLAAVVSIMPQPVLGGAAVMMFASIIMSGIQLITKEPVTARTITIVSVAIGYWLRARQQRGGPLLHAAGGAVRLWRLRHCPGGLRGDCHEPCHPEG